MFIALMRLVSLTLLSFSSSSVPLPLLFQTPFLFGYHQPVQFPGFIDIVFIWVHGLHSFPQHLKAYSSIIIMNNLASIMIAVIMRMITRTIPAPMLIKILNNKKMGTKNLKLLLLCFIKFLFFHQMIAL